MEIAVETEAPSERAVHYDVCAWVVIATNVLGQTYRFAQNRGLRYDECRVALNLLERDYLGLTQPLKYEQAAPIGFLWFEKLMIEVLGNNEWSLRLLAFLAGLACPIVVWGFSRISTIPRVAAIATFWMALQYHVMQYSGEVKQYALDVTIAAGLLAYGSWLIRSWMTATRVFGLCVAGAVSIWFSHPSVFIFAGVWLGVAGCAWYSRQKDDVVPGWQPVVVLAALGAGAALFTFSFAINYRIAVLPLLAQGWTRESWAEYFAPFPPTRVGDFLWYVKATEQLLWSEYSSVYVGLILLAPFVIGIKKIGSAQPWLTVMLVTPMALALVLSGLGKFGFANRQLLFLQPAVIFIGAHGIDCLLYRVRGARFEVERTAWRTATAICALATSGVYLLGGPWHVNSMETKPAAQYIVGQIAPGDVLYITQSAHYPFQYYAPKLATSTGVTLDAWPHLFWGRYEGSDPAGYEQELNALLEQNPRPGRIWVVSAKLTWLGWKDVRPAIRDALGRHGAVDQYDTPGVTVLSIARPAEISDISAPRGG